MCVGLVWPGVRGFGVYNFGGGLEFGGGGGCGVVCVWVCIYIHPRSPKKFQKTIDFLPPTCYNGNVKINGERRI